MDVSRVQFWQDLGPFGFRSLPFMLYPSGSSRLDRLVNLPPVTTAAAVPESDTAQHIGNQAPVVVAKSDWLDAEAMENVRKARLKRWHGQP